MQCPASPLSALKEEEDQDALKTIHSTAIAAKIANVWGKAALFTSMVDHKLRSKLFAADDSRTGSASKTTSCIPR
jgi:hypothetical protein